MVFINSLYFSYFGVESNSIKREHSQYRKKTKRNYTLIAKKKRKCFNRNIKKERKKRKENLRKGKTINVCTKPGYTKL